MVDTLRKLFSPLLAPLESVEGEFHYKPSHRKILLAVGGLFAILALVSVVAAAVTGRWGAAIPVAVFSAASLVCLIVGWLGNDRAVARLWGNR